MKRKSRTREIRLKEKRERKRKKRKGKGFDPFSGSSAARKELLFKLKSDERRLERYRFDFDLFLDENSSPQNVKPKVGVIKLPKYFTLEHDAEAVFIKIKEIRKTLMQLSGGELLLDFKKCRKLDFSSLFLMRIVLTEYLEALDKLDKKLNVLKTRPVIRVSDSVSLEVNLQLLASSFITSVNENDREPNLLPVTALRYRKGSKRQHKYSENKKGKVATDMRKYVNECLKKHDTILTAQEERDFDGIISETLNNAEDHSSFDSWYAFGNFFTSNTSNDIDFVGEVNLAIMNFGYSIFDGIMDTKNENIQQFQDIKRLHDAVIEKDRRKNFTTENLFTLYALQEGISRLKHEDGSRGTGTMTFIQSFMELGDYENKSNGYQPSLMIYSGNTVVKCEPKYKPFKKEGRYYISLNQSKNLAELPDKNNLWSSKKRLPGTLLVVKMYLNKTHLHKKIDNGD